jgi:plastocyanin
LNVFKADEGIQGPDGRTHDSFVPSGFVVKAGLPVHLTLVNHDDGAHTMTLDSSNAGFGPFMVKPWDAVGQNVKPVNSTFDFTPTKKGAFRWHCEVFCDDAANHWAMGHAIAPMANHGGALGPSSQKAEVGFMAGYILVR